MQNDEWSFTIDEDGMVLVGAPSGVSENLRLALETLIIPFGTDVDSVRNYLRQWSRMWREFGVGFSLGTPTATVKREAQDQVEIGDHYKQFETCSMEVAEFERFIGLVIEFLESEISDQSLP